MPLPRTGPSSRCRLQLTTKIRLSSFSREASVRAPIDSGSSISPSPRNAQTLRSVRGMMLAVLQVAHEARLVDGVDRPDAHGNRRELPEIRHQPRMRIGRQPGIVAQLVAEILQMLFGQAAFEEGARVNARRSVALEVDQVARLVADTAAEEVVEPDFGQRRQRGIGRDVAADVRRRTCSRGPPWPWRSSESGF